MDLSGMCLGWNQWGGPNALSETDALTFVDYCQEQGLREEYATAWREIARRLYAGVEDKSGFPLPPYSALSQWLGVLADGNWTNEPMPRFTLPQLWRHVVKVEETGRYDLVKAALETGWVCDARFLVKADYATHKHLKKYKTRGSGPAFGGRSLPLDILTERKVYDFNEFDAHVVGTRMGEVKMHCLVLDPNGDRRIVDSKILAMARVIVPDASLRIPKNKDKKHEPLAFVKDGEIVGLIVPLLVD